MHVLLLLEEETEKNPNTTEGNKAAEDIFNEERLKSKLEAVRTIDPGRGDRKNPDTTELCRGHFRRREVEIQARDSRDNRCNWTYFEIHILLAGLVAFITVLATCFRSLDNCPF